MRVGGQTRDRGGFEGSRQSVGAKHGYHGRGQAWVPWMRAYVYAGGVYGMCRGQAWVPWYPRTLVLSDSRTRTPNPVLLLTYTYSRTPTPYPRTPYPYQVEVRVPVWCNGWDVEHDLMDVHSDGDSTIQHSLPPSSICLAIFASYCTPFISFSHLHVRALCGCDVACTPRGARILLWM